MNYIASVKECCKYSAVRLILITNLSICLFASPAYGQKRHLLLGDLSGYLEWPRLGWESGITHDGDYAFYNLVNQGECDDILVVQATQNTWRIEFNGGRQAHFSDDGRFIYFLKGTDRLLRLRLGSSEIEVICANVTSYQLFKKGDFEWLSYHEGTPQNTLVLKKLRSRRAWHYPGVESYYLAKDGSKVVIKQVFDADISDKSALSWIDVTTGKKQIFWTGEGLGEIIWDHKGLRVAFVTSSKNAHKSIWVYQIGTCNATILKGNCFERKFALEEVTRFSLDDERLFIAIKEKPNCTVNATGLSADIWTYCDLNLQSQQLIENVKGYGLNYVGPRVFAATVNVKTGTLIILQKANEQIQFITSKTNDLWALITHRAGSSAESHWNLASQSCYYLVSTKTGDRTPVPVPFYTISPENRFLIGLNERGDHFSYELSTGQIRDFTEILPIQEGDQKDDKPIRASHRGIGFWGYWILGDEALLLYDRYDIWLVDPKGLRLPVNLTNGFGRKNKIVFRFVAKNNVFKKGEKILLDAFDETTKNNGFYRLELGNIADPIMLNMGSFVFGAKRVDGIKPMKARDTESYLVQRKSAIQSPNYFWTRDFKSFTALSHVFPERQYNWLTSELHTFRTLDGRYEQGILYKPANFDPFKKYPIILHYYETKSDNLNQFFVPAYSDGNINIPWFVSNGYLVFTPDIHYEVGSVGQSAASTIVGAGRYLKGLPFVNANCMGLSGHSFGGYQTNYVITHSNLFAAAVADAGAVNFISGFGSCLRQTGESLQKLHELTYYRMGGGVTPWSRPKIYIVNSPIFNADKIHTPLLIIQNKLDAIVHFDNGIQFFSALRSLKRAVWMLQYDGEEHNVSQRRNQRDLTIRITTFFNHYLKREPMPGWMTRCTPAIMKGLINDSIVLNY